MEAWLVNTNSNKKNGNPNAFKFMLRQRKVPVYVTRKEGIAPMTAGDLVLLYHNDNMIIAVGFALRKPFDDFDHFDVPDTTHNVERWIDVNWIWQARFNTNFKAVTPILRQSVGIKSYLQPIQRVTKQVNYAELFKAMGKLQEYL